MPEVTEHPQSILFVESGSMGGGSFQSLYLMLSVLDRTRLRPVVVFLNPTRYQVMFREMGLTVHTLFDPACSVSVPWWLRKRFEHLADRSHLRFPRPVAEFLVRLAHWPLMRSLKRLARRERVDLLYSNNQPNRNIFMPLLARDTGLPLVCHLRSMDADSFNAAKRETVDPEVDRYVAISEAVRDCWVGRGVPAEKIEVVYNGLPQRSVDALDLHAEFKLPAGQRVIGIVSQLDWEKGHAFLLRSLARMHRPDVTLLVVGDGEKRTEFEALAGELGIAGQVVFTGYTDKALPIIASLDILVQPSMTDSFSRTVLEAMWLKTPVIASDTGGIREVLEDGVNGRIVEYGDEEELASTMAELLAAPAACSRQAEAAAVLVAERFDLVRNAGRIERRLLELLDANGT